MSRRRDARAVLIAAALAFLGAAPVPTQADVDAVVLEAAIRQREGEVGAGRVAFERVEVETDLDAAGRPEKTRRRRYAVVMDGRGVVRRDLLEVDGRPATGEERQESLREDEKRRKAAGKGGEKSDEEELMSGRVPLLDLHHRLDFRYLGEELLEGRPTWVVGFRPKPGLESRTIRDRVLNSFAGRTWIDVADVQLKKIDGRLMAPVKVLGGALLRLEGIRLVYEAREAAPGSWVPCREEIGIRATAGMVLPFRREMRFEFSNWRSAREAAPSRTASR